MRDQKLPEGTIFLYPLQDPLKNPLQDPSKILSKIPSKIPCEQFVHSSYDCEVCGKPFKSWSDLNIHSKSTQPR